MTNKLQPLRGTKDLLPLEFAAHDHIINTGKNIGVLYGYKPMSTPIIEYTSVYNRTLGETSDAISKEIYSFQDRSDESIALRPEFTAGVMRAYLSNSLTHSLPLKFFSSGPLFRYDRPQLGRQRQLHQINYEYIGAVGAHTDAETIKLACDVLCCLGILDDTILELNSLGCNESRALYQAKLEEYFNDHKDHLSEDSVQRLSKNPMRILDSKDERDKKLIENAPLISESYTPESKEYFESVRMYLNTLEVKYTLNNRLVRGLDYYCHTAFEFTTSKLGAQSSVIGGGRYDGLAEIMGGPATPAIGFAAGIERLALMIEHKTTEPRLVYVLPIGEENTSTGLFVASKLRDSKIPAVLDTKGKIDKRLTRALNNQARYAIFIGDAERDTGNFKIKDLDSRIEMAANIVDIINLIKNHE